MYRPLEIFIGLRYTRAERRNHFISFISLTSMVGIALGVTALITVLSVMNGFENELRQRILGMTSHATISAYGGDMREWAEIRAQVSRHERVLGSAPFIQKEGMLINGDAVNGTVIRGIVPELEPQVSEVATKLVDGRLEDLREGEFGIILGGALASQLGVMTGDKVTLVTPSANVTPAGVMPRMPTVVTQMSGRGSTTGGAGRRVIPPPCLERAVSAARSSHTAAPFTASKAWATNLNQCTRSVDTPTPTPIASAAVVDAVALQPANETK